MSLAKKSVGISIATAAAAALFAASASAQMANTHGSSTPVMSNAAGPTTAMSQGAPATSRPSAVTQTAGASGNSTMMAKASNGLK